MTDSQYARRITPETEMAISGPAAGHELLKTSADPTGTKVLGTVNNCAGGKTPWGTVLMAEENFNGYFGGTAPETGPLAETYKRYGVPGGWNAWYKTVDRFDVGEGAERAAPLRLDGRVRPLRSGFRPDQAHRARPPQARGRHHDRQQGRPPGASTTGDDERFDYLYKYVSNGTFTRSVRAAPRMAPCSTTVRSMSPSSTTTR